MTKFPIVLVCVVVLGVDTLSQALNTDSLWTVALRHHDRSMHLRSIGQTKEALLELDSAVDAFYDYQGYRQLTADSLRSLYAALSNKYPESSVFVFLHAQLVDDFSQKESEYEKTIRMDPLYYRPYVSLGRTYQRKGDYTKAELNFLASIRVDSGRSSGYESLLSLYLSTNREDEYVSLRKKLIQRDSSSINGSYSLLDLARREKDIQEKKRLYGLVIANGKVDWHVESAYQELLFLLTSSDPDSAESLARYVLSFPSARQGKLRQSALLAIFQAAKRRSLERFIQVVEEINQESDPYVLYQIGNYCADSLGNLNIGLKLLHHAYESCVKQHALNTLIVGSYITDEQLEKVAKNGRTFIAFKLGSVHRRNKQYNEAEKFLLEAIQSEQGGKDAKPYFELGSLNVDRNDNQKAAEWFSRGLAIQFDKDAANTLNTLRLGSSQPSTEEMIRKERTRTAKPAPDFKLLSLSGDSVRLSDLRGKVVLIDFWATWCGPCVAEMPFLEKISQRYKKDKRFEFLSISTDVDIPVLKKFVTDNKLSAKVLYGRSVMKEYNIEAIPIKFLVGADGKIYNSHLGFPGTGDKVIEMLSHEIDYLLGEAAKMR